MNVSQSQLSAFQNPLSESSLRVRPFASGPVSQIPAPHGGFVINNLKQKLWVSAPKVRRRRPASFERLRSREVGRERRKRVQDSWIVSPVYANSEILTNHLFHSIPTVRPLGPLHRLPYMPKPYWIAARCYPRWMEKSSSAMVRRFDIHKISGRFGGESREKTRHMGRKSTVNRLDGQPHRSKVLASKLQDKARTRALSTNRFEACQKA